MKQIEFFGISSSGKSYLKDLLLKRNSYNKNIYSYKKIISEFLINEENNFFQKLLLKIYFFYKSSQSNRYIMFTESKFVKIKKKKVFFKFSILKSIIARSYTRNIEKIFKKNKNQSFKNFVMKLIKNSHFNDNNKDIFIKWFQEEMAAKYLIKKNFTNIHCVLDSEGFIQRLFIYLYKKKNKKKLIQKYLSMCPLPDLVCVTNLKRFQIKIFDNTEFNLEYSEQKKIYSNVVMVLKKKVPVQTINKKNLRKISI